jgi:hypothetical protein
MAKKRRNTEQENSGMRALKLKIFRQRQWPQVLTGDLVTPFCPHRKRVDIRPR